MDTETRATDSCTAIELRPDEPTSKAVQVDGDKAENSQHTFRLFDLPPELWIRCCQFAVIRSEPIIIDSPDERQQVEALVAQPSITRTCRSIRAETLSLFYKSNDFRFLDDGECTLCGLKDWVKALWSTHWPLVQRCIVESAHDDIIDHLTSEFKSFAVLEFDGDAPEDEEPKILKLTAKALPATKYDEGEGNDGKEESEEAGKSGTDQ